MAKIDSVEKELVARPQRWLVTGAAGFIGSNLVERLLLLGQRVVGLDNFATGHRRNIEDVRIAVGEAATRFEFIEGDIRDVQACARACTGVDIVLHEAALGSVPRSIADPATTNAVNIDGFVNMLVAARDAKVSRFVFASSSSVYGDHPALPKVEAAIGRPLSPYAVTKLANELYARVFQDAYGLACIGLRYFNVFGPRQDPEGPYAAVIPRWVGAILKGEKCVIFGDGETSRDFCFVDNAIQANILAATAESSATGQIYNVAYGERTTLKELFHMLRGHLAQYEAKIASYEPEYGSFRPGDVRHSLADLRKARELLEFAPAHSVAEGLRRTMAWYVQSHGVELR